LSAAAVPARAAPQIVARPLVWITSPPVSVTKGQLLEISGQARVEEPIVGNNEGLEIVDSLGGPELALRVGAAEDWRPFRMIRGVPETSDMTVTFALTGLGTACVDAVTIRPLERPSARRLPAVTSDSGPLFPDSARRSLFAPPQPR
jgi:hypothetical protein